MEFRVYYYCLLSVPHGWRYATSCCYFALIDSAITRHAAHAMPPCAIAMIFRRHDDEYFATPLRRHFRRHFRL